MHEIYREIITFLLEDLELIETFLSVILLFFYFIFNFEALKLPEILNVRVSIAL